MTRTTIASIAFAAALGAATMAVALEREGRSVNPSTQVNISSGISKGAQKARTGRTMRRARP